MKVGQRSQVDTAKEVDCLIMLHLVQQADDVDGGVPVAPITQEDRRFGHAKQAWISNSSTRDWQRFAAKYRRRTPPALYRDFA